MITLNDKLKIVKAINVAYYIDGGSITLFDPVKDSKYIAKMILWLLEYGKFTHFDTEWMEFSLVVSGSRINLSSFDHDNVAENLMALTLKVINRLDI